MAGTAVPVLSGCMCQCPPGKRGPKCENSELFYLFIKYDIVYQPIAITVLPIKHVHMCPMKHIGLLPIVCNV